MKSIKELVKMSQSVSALYSDTSPNRHTDGFVQDWGISSALAMEILQTCAKPWIWYQCICCLSTFLPKYFLQNINNSLVAKRTIHGRTFSRPLDSWVAFGDRATIFQQQLCNVGRWLDCIMKYHQMPMHWCACCLRYIHSKCTYLTHSGLLTPYGDIGLGQYWLR